MIENSPGDRLRNLRLSCGLTQEMLAAEIGRTANTIANWENGRNRMPRTVARLVARALGVDIQELR